MSKISLIAAIAAAFLANKNESKMLVCDDGMPFRVKDKSFADLHARKEKIGFKEYNRADYEKEIAEAEKAEAERTGKSVEPASNSGAEGSKAKPIDKMNVNELKEALTALNVAFEEDAKKADLVTLLTEAKNSTEGK